MTALADPAAPSGLSCFEDYARHSAGLALGRHLSLNVGEALDRKKQIATLCYMSTVIRISKDLAQEAKTRSAVEKRSMTGQVEYWARIGRIAEENPDLPFSFIKELLIAREEAKLDKEEYVFG